MPEIYLDGEPVLFDGPAPSSLQALLSLIEQSLATGGRVVAAVTIDGLANDGTLDEAAFAAAGRVVISSLSVHEAIAQIMSTCSRSAGELRGVAAELSGEVLGNPWGEVAPKLVSLGEQLAGLLQQLGSLGGAQDSADLAADLESGLHRWMDAVAARDAGEVFLKLEQAIVPQLERIASLAEGSPEAPQA